MLLPEHQWEEQGKKQKNKQEKRQLYSCAESLDAQLQPNLGYLHIYKLGKTPQVPGPPWAAVRGHGPSKTQQTASANLSSPEAENTGISIKINQPTSQDTCSLTSPQAEKVQQTPLGRHGRPGAAAGGSVGVGCEPLCKPAMASLDAGAPHSK